MQGNRVKSDNKHCHDHVPKSVKTSHGGQVPILWNQQVRIDRTISIIICDDKKGTCMLIDEAIPGDRNVINKEAEILKYKRPHNRNSMHVECETKVISVIIRATGTISK